MNGKLHRNALKKTNPIAFLSQSQDQKFDSGLMKDFPRPFLVMAWSRSIFTQSELYVLSKVDIILSKSKVGVELIYLRSLFTKCSCLEKTFGKVHPEQGRVFPYSKYARNTRSTTPARLCHHHFKGRRRFKSLASLGPLSLSRKLLTAMITSEVFSCFVFYATLLVLKMYAIAIITGQLRLRKKVRVWETKSGTICLFAYKCKATWRLFLPNKGFCESGGRFETRRSAVPQNGSTRGEMPEVK